MHRAAFANVIAAAALLLCSSDAWAGFDWNGFKSGMSVDAARAQLNAMGMTITNEDVTSSGPTILAVRDSTQGKLPIVLNFCGKKLYQAQFDLPPSFAFFVRTAQEHEASLGPPSTAHAESRISSIGETNGLSIWWRQSYGWFTVHYNQYPSNDQLYLFFEDINICG